MNIQIKQTARDVGQWWTSFFAPTALDRYRPMWIAFQTALLLIGILFWVSLGMGVSAFQPQIWGEWASQFPAKAWAGLMMVSAALVVTGLIRPVAWRRIVVGCSLQSMQMVALAYSASFTGGEFVISVYPTLLFVPAYLILIAQAVRHAD